MEVKPEIVMTGVSGRFPQSDNMEEFENNLYNGVDMITADDTRWPVGHFNLPHRSGKLKMSAIEKFDAEFFDVPEKKVMNMDPTQRIFLELTYEALVDAGYDPADLRGSNTGFFWGSCFAENHSDFDDPTSNTVSMNYFTTVSQFFDWRGPVLHTDTACNSSLNAVNMAVQALRAKTCDRVLVATSNTTFRPLVSLRFKDLKMICKDGTSKCLDEKADGYCRSEAMAVVLLERADVAKRVYAKVLNSKSGSDGFKDEGITFPSMNGQRWLAQETYEEVGINPADIGYIEAHVTGTSAGDPVEMQAMYELICSKKSEPLLVGCIKSQVGHAEGASGLCSIAKALIVLQNRSIPPNLYFKTPNPNIEGLLNGKMKPVTRITPLPGTIIPVNSFGFGGANTHVVLQGVYPDGGKGTPMSTPRLVTACARTVEGVHHILKKIESERKLQTNEFLALLDNFSNIRENKFNFRGYVLVTKCLVSGKLIFEHGDVQAVKPTSSEVYLTMDVDENSNSMNQFTQTFAVQSKMEKLASDLKSTGVDLMSLMANGASSMREQTILRVATQIACIDALREVGVKVDGLIGNQINASVKSYFDGKLSTENVLLNAVNKAEVTLNVPATAGATVLDLDYGLKGLGDLYNKGFVVRSSKLATPVTYPLPSSTPTLSSLLKWNHAKTYSLKPYLVQDNFIQKSRTLRYYCDSRNMDDAFMFDHKIDERTLYPATGYLMVAWITLTKYIQTSIWDHAVEFKDVAFHRATVLKKGAETELHVRYSEDTGKFIVTESDTAVVTGTIVIRKDLDHELELPEPCADDNSEPIVLQAKQLYKEFRVRGYDYGPYFQGLDEASSDGRRAKLIWRDVMHHSLKDALAMETDLELSAFWLRSWVPFVDAMFQLDIIKEDNDSRSLFVPTRIESLICSPELLRKNIESSPKYMDAMTQSEASLVDTFGREDNLIWTKGLVVKGLKCTVLKRKQQMIRLKKYELTHFDEKVTFGQRDRMLVENYRAACLAAAKGRDVPHSFKLEDPKYALLRSLTTSGSNLSENATQDLARDLLVGDLDDDFFFPERFLLPAISMVVTSLHLQVDVINPFDVLEVTSGGHSLNGHFEELFDQILSEDTLKLNYNILTLKVDLLQQNVRESKLVKVHNWAADNYGVATASMDMIIYRSSPEDPQDAVARLTSLLKVGGFLYQISRERNPMLKEFGLDQNNVQEGAAKNALWQASAAGLTLVGEKRLSDSLPIVAHFFRKVTQVNPDDVRVVEMGVCDYDRWFENLKLFLREENSARDKRVWLVSRAMEPKDVTPIIGLVKTLKFEEGGERLRSLVDYSATGPIDLFDPKYAEILKKDLPVNVLDKTTGKWGSYEYHKITDEELSVQDKVTEHCYLRTMKPGDMSSLTWVASDVSHRAATMCANTHRMINVHYSALNFRDIMFASGRLDSEAIPGIHSDVAQDSILGLEYSGVDRKTGQRVMGITPYKGLASTVLATDDEKDFIWPVPESWTLEDAATVPVVYATALYALVIRGKLTAGESVLIHSGCGGVGLAAINIALAMGCKVFTTVGSPSKRAFLVDKWPQLRGHMFNSRELTFELDILKATSGRGVDVILNSLAEEKLQASLRCLAANGRFLEIGKVDFIQNSQLFSHQLSENQSFHGVLLDALFRYSSKTYLPLKMQAERRQLRNLVLKGIHDGSVRPLERTLFSRSNVEDAFRFMSSGKHVGKVLIQMAEGQDSPNAVRGATYCHPNKVYIVLGGAGGFGLEVVQWLAQRGAKKIVIASRRGLREPYQHYAIAKLRKKDVKVTIDHSDITKEAGARQLLAIAQKDGPVGGLFNTAVVYKDSLYSDALLSNFKDVCGPKAHASLHFDKLTRELCPELDYFVTWSSLSCSRGNAGQSSYSYANSLMDSICEKRCADGLPGLSIQWGVVGDVGTLSESASSNEMVLLGSQAQRIHSCLDTIDKCLQTSIPVVLSYVKALKDDGSSKESDSIDIMNVITRLLGLKDISNLDQETTLGSLGVDSLIAVEIKQALDKTLGSQTSVKEVRDLTIARLVEMSAEQYTPVAPPPSE